MPIVEAVGEVVGEVNEGCKRAMAQKIVRPLEDQPQGKTVAVLGPTFKPNTDDMREAPSIDIVHRTT